LVTSVAWRACSSVAVLTATMQHRKAADGQNMLPLDSLASQAEKQKPYMVQLPNCIDR